MVPTVIRKPSGAEYMGVQIAESRRAGSAVTAGSPRFCFRIEVVLLFHTGPRNLKTCRPVSAVPRFRRSGTLPGSVPLRRPNIPLPLPRGAAPCIPERYRRQTDLYKPAPSGRFSNFLYTFYQHL